MTDGIGLVLTAGGPPQLDLGWGLLIDCEPGWVIEYAGSRYFLPGSVYHREDDDDGTAEFVHTDTGAKFLLDTTRIRVGELTRDRDQFRLVMPR